MRLGQKKVNAAEAGNGNIVEVAAEVRAEVVATTPIQIADDIVAKRDMNGKERQEKEKWKKSVYAK